MRLAIPLLVLLLCLVGCDGQPDLRPEPVEIKGVVNLPGSTSPKNLTLTFHPQQNTQPGGAKLQPDGSFTVKLVPGDYIVYFEDEANAKVGTYKTLPAKYRSPSEENVISVRGGEPLTINVN